MLVLERVGQDECVEPVIFDRCHPVAFAGPGSDPRRYRKDGMAAVVQVLDEQAPGPLDRDRDPAGEPQQPPVQLGQAGDIVAHLTSATFWV
jgi:hypothetical protein